MKIMMDDREKLDREVLEELGDVEVCRLSECDYVCEELGVCIERKTIDDFCSSVIDGRLKKQVKAMNEVYKHNFVLVSGRLKDKVSEISEHSVLGMMVSLIVKYGVNIVMFDDDKQLAWFMKRLFERFEEISDEVVYGIDDKSCGDYWMMKNKCSSVV